MMKEEYQPQITLTDFPKIQCPFIRQTFKVDEDQWSKHGSLLKLKKPEVYLVVNQINAGYEWVFEDPQTIAVEKLDGTNVKILTEKGRLIAIQNRKNPIDLLQVMKGKTFILESIFQSIGKGYVKSDGEQAGEVIGPKVQGNPYQLDVHEWFPFERAVEVLSYRSFLEHERNFDNWSSWFKDYLISRYFTKRASKLGLARISHQLSTPSADSASSAALDSVGPTQHTVKYASYGLGRLPCTQGGLDPLMTKSDEKCRLDEKVFAEGVVFYNLKRKAEGKTYMAKLRRDMFDWFYSNKIKIFDYDKSGRVQMEDQEKFD